jgi:hypothetical protein
MMDAYIDGLMDCFDEIWHDQGSILVSVEECGEAERFQ